MARPEPPDTPRRPLAARLRNTTAERRQNRLQLGSCSTCHHDDYVSVILGMEYVLSLRCDRCLAVHTV